MNYRLSKRAEADLLDIGSFTVERWGEEQSHAYLDELKACLKMLAERPKLGRESDLIEPGLRRFEKESHVVFYRESLHGITISRILHGKMLPVRHKF